MAEIDAFMLVVNLLWYVLTASRRLAHSIKRTLSSI